MRMDVRFWCQAHRAEPICTQGSALAFHFRRVKIERSTPCRISATWRQSRQRKWLWPPGRRGVRAVASPFSRVRSGRPSTSRVGRTGGSERSEMDRPETVEETAALVDEAGGCGIPVRVDHLVPEEAGALVARIRRERGCRHVLVIGIRGARIEWDRPVWESSLGTGLHTLRLAVDTHAITSHHALPLLIGASGGLVVEVTDGTDEYNAGHYRVSFFYGLAKASVNRMAFAPVPVERTAGEGLRLHRSRRRPARRPEIRHRGPGPGPARRRDGLSLTAGRGPKPDAVRRAPGPPVPRRWPVRPRRRPRPRGHARNGATA